MSMSAPSANSVHVAVPMGAGRKKGRNGFDYEEQGDDVVIYDVPIFDTYHDSTMPEPFDRMNLTRLREVLEHTQWQEQAGRYPKLIVGHTEAGEKQTEQFIFGRAENARIQSNPDLGGKPSIYTDWRVERNFFDAELKDGRFPGRSIELEQPNPDEPHNGFYISNIAALRATPPKRPLRDMGRFERYQRRDGAVRVARFDKEVPIMAEIAEDRLKELIAEAYAKGAKDTQKFMGGAKCEEDKKSEDYAEDDDKGDKGDKGEQGEKGDKGDKGESDKHSRRDSAAKYAALEQNVARYQRDAAELRQQLDGMKSSQRAERVAFQMADWQRRGYQFGGDDDLKAEVARLCAIGDDDTYSKECARIERFYSRVPVNARVNMEHVTTGTSAPTDAETKIEAATRQYMKDHPALKYHEAQTAVARGIKEGSVKL